MGSLLKIDINHDRIYGLDIIRSLAILFVVIEHGNNLLPQKYFSTLYLFVFDGVSLFFVLSGFLIGGILIKEFENNNITFKVIIKFWKRRWFRTLPNYFLVLIILILLQFLFATNFPIRSISKYFIFSQNLYYPQSSFFPESWCLSVEEWFYLLTPLIILAVVYTFKLSNRKSIIYASLSVIIFITLFRVYRYMNFKITEYNDWDNMFRKEVITRLDSIMFGVIGSYISFYHKSLWLKYKKNLLFIGIILLLFPKLITFRQNTYFYFCVLSFSFNSLGALLLMPYLSNINNGKGFIFKAVTYISLISYSMYLINLTIVQNWILNNIDVSYFGIYGMLLKYFLFWALTILISIVMYKYFEIPMTKLRDKVTWTLKK